MPTEKKDSTQDNHQASSVFGLPSVVASRMKLFRPKGVTRFSVLFARLLVYINYN